MQGWSPDFVSKLTADTLCKGHVDDVVPVNGSDALRLARALATDEGIFCGISGGATLAAALSVCEKAPKGSSVLFMVPDTGERYLSTALFDDIGEAMSDEELEIATSTEGFRISAPAPQKPQKQAATASVAPSEPSAEATSFVETALADEAQPVVMFALEWCEFCWALHKFFRAHGIPYRSIDLDSVLFQHGNLGGEIRKELHRRTGFGTIPQVFVGGRAVGGCTDTLQMFSSGEFQSLLASHRVTFNRDVAGDPSRFLPKWVHPR